MGMGIPDIFPAHLWSEAYFPAHFRSGACSGSLLGVSFRLKQGFDYYFEFRVKIDSASLIFFIFMFSYFWL